MAYIEVHQGLIRHRKTYLLAANLGVSRQVAVGHLLTLWTWALDSAEDGDLTALPDVAIADACEWTDDAPAFVAALTAAGFLDADRKIHDWWDYAGKLILQRRVDAQRKREGRAKEKGRMSGGCPADVHPSGVQTAGVTNPREPKSTKPPYSPPCGDFVNEDTETYPGAIKQSTTAYPHCRRLESWSRHEYRRHCFQLTYGNDSFRRLEESLARIASALQALGESPDWEQYIAVKALAVIGEEPPTFLAGKLCQVVSYAVLDLEKRVSAKRRSEKGKEDTASPPAMPRPPTDEEILLAIHKEQKRTGTILSEEQRREFAQRMRGAVTA